jgi:hypothetical protein
MTHIKEYHHSIGQELSAVKNRVRLLLEDTHHWGSDGTYKEDILKEVLRRHLPLTTGIYSGFVKLGNKCTRQIDIILTDENKNTLFKSNDFCITTPSAVHAIIEVKTSIQDKVTLKKALEVLRDNIAQIRTSKNQGTFTHNRIHPWSALFSFDAFTDIPRERLKTKLEDIVKIFNEIALGEIGNVIQCACLGPNVFIKYWEESTCWEAYYLENLAYSYFLSNILWRDEPNNNESPLWFPLTEGKGPYTEARALFTFTPNTPTNLIRG